MVQLPKKIGLIGMMDGWLAKPKERNGVMDGWLSHVDNLII